MASDAQVKVEHRNTEKYIENKKSGKGTYIRTQ